MPTQLVDGLNPSGAVVANGHLVIHHNDRYLALALGQGQHFSHFLGILFHIKIVMVLIRLPGLCGIGSPGFSVNNDAIGHQCLLGLG